MPRGSSMVASRKTLSFQDDQDAAEERQSSPQDERRGDGVLFVEKQERKEEGPERVGMDERDHDRQLRRGQGPEHAPVGPRVGEPSPQEEAKRKGGQASQRAMGAPEPPTASAIN